MTSVPQAFPGANPLTFTVPPTMHIAGDEKQAVVRRANLTTRSISAFRLPPGRSEAVLYDLKVPGLIWRLRRPNSGAFYYQKRINGKKVCTKIGGKELPVEEARGRAVEMAGDAAKGIDPQSRRREQRAAGATLGELLDRWLEHGRQHKAAASVEDEECMIERHLSDWRDRRLADIKQEHIRQLHARLGKKHPYMANRVLALLSAAYNHAGDLSTGPNPVKGIQKFREVQRDRFLQADELCRFFESLAVEPNETIRDYLLILLLVGARRANTSAMRWDELDLARGVWRIPMTKNKQPLLVPLAGEAIRILEHRKESASSAWVFPTATTKKMSKSGHIEDFRQTWGDILKRAGIEGFRAHDLRRTLGSWLAIGGSSLPIIGRLLGHRTQQATAIYARLSLDPVSAAVEKATTAMMQAGRTA